MRSGILIVDPQLIQRVDYRPVRLDSSYTLARCETSVDESSPNCFSGVFHRTAHLDGLKKFLLNDGASGVRNVPSHAEGIRLEIFGSLVPEISEVDCASGELSAASPTELIPGHSAANSPRGRERAARC